MGKYAEIEKRLEVAKYKLFEVNSRLPAEDETLREAIEDVIEAHRLIKSLSNGNKTRKARWEREIKAFEKFKNKEQKININDNKKVK